MPWVCSERRRWRLAGAAAALSLAAAAGLLSPAARGSAGSVWRLGVFPVVNFAGYTSHFGTRTGPWGRVEPHYGLDIAAPLGSPIRNWWGGVVQSVIHDGTCGLGLVIRSGDYEHIYCHLSGSVQGGVYRSGRVQVRQGQAVRMGELIGHVGVTGRSTGPHLHWGMRFRGDWIDPALVLREMARARRAGSIAPTAPPAPRVALSR
jgi:murein DD-endopeptidase MepM/ murein hydrolase activator NlpD